VPRALGNGRIFDAAVSILASNAANVRPLRTQTFASPSSYGFGMPAERKLCIRNPCLAKVFGLRTASVVGRRKYPVAENEESDDPLIVPAFSRRHSFPRKPLNMSIMHAPKVEIAQPPRIQPISDGEPRPFWSVMIPTYNCANYLRETLLSVLSQDPGPEHMEIEVVDDCSTKDDPEAIVRELGRGRVRFFRQPRNTGPIGNFNTRVRRSRGQWLHILHGDDTVRAGYYARAQDAIAAHPNAGAVTFRYIFIFEDGHWQHLSELESRTPGVLGNEFIDRMMLTNVIMFPAMIVRRSVYEDLGGFRPELVHCADWDMWLRTVLHRPIVYDPEPLACYRVHAAADTARLVSTGENVADERRFARILSSYVPPNQARIAYRNGRKAAAIRATRRAQDLWRKGHRATALIQLREAIRSSASPAVLMHLVRVTAWAIAREQTTSPSAQEIHAPSSRSHTIA
jgi:glycosyltransferase involved in cell wall biosynthesis